MVYTTIILFSETWKSDMGSHFAFLIPFCPNVGSFVVFGCQITQNMVQYILWMIPLSSNIYTNTLWILFTWKSNLASKYEILCFDPFLTNLKLFFSRLCKPVRSNHGPRYTYTWLFFVENCLYCENVIIWKLGDKIWAIKWYPTIYFITTNWDTSF